MKVALWYVVASLPYKSSGWPGLNLTAHLRFNGLLCRYVNALFGARSSLTVDDTARKPLSTDIRSSAIKLPSLIDSGKTRFLITNRSSACLDYFGYYLRCFQNDKAPWTIPSQDGILTSLEKRALENDNNKTH